MQRPAIDASRVLETLREILDATPDPGDEPALKALRARIVELDELREWFGSHPEIRQLFATALRRAGAQAEALSDALAARRVDRTPGTLRRFRWALWAVVEPGLRLDPDARPAPDDLDAWMAGGHVLGEISRLHEAADWFGHVVTVAPDHVEAQALRAWTRWLLDVEPHWVDEVAALARDWPDEPLPASLLAEMTGSGTDAEGS